MRLKSDANRRALLLLLPVPGVPEVFEQISNIRERLIELPSDNEINLLLKDAEINDLKNN